ncbi:NAD(P)H-dependent oxidoreductase, partial [uncultured Brevundimonas sp.]|uniref:NADPH-dependent FMN reductase n=1 Tax=uncultured Brevundimonas sp. TaxID=213418 RepID=UPI0034341CB6
NSFDGKPVAVIGTSPGAIGTAVAQSALRPILGFLNVAQLGQPEAYIQFKPDLIDADHKVTNADTEGFLRKYMQTFVDFASQHKG